MEETLFFVTGLALVAVALILAFWGLRHEERFPNKTALRVGSVLFTALVIVVATTAVLNAREEQENREAEHAAEEMAAQEEEAVTGGAAGTLAFTVPPGTELIYDQKSAEAKAGTVEIELDNKSEVGHDVTIEQDGQQLGKTDIISASTATTTIDLKPGEYVFFCSVPGHREAGMEGTLTIAK